ncbi:hypothetical protein [Streptomyces sp. NPDC048637]|uniref:hypothetical protein n=1 Tax=Streptomyces sp. NPDC048637 TaxID=3155636 RepID=UPI00344988E0
MFIRAHNADQLLFEEQWLGEIEGIDLTLTFLRTKQAEVIRSPRRTAVDLGLPRPRTERDRACHVDPAALPPRPRAA